MQLTLLRLLSASVLFAIPSAGAAQSLSEKFDQYIEARSKLGHFNGTVLVAKDGKILVNRGVGWADFEHRVPAAPATRYAVASLTKQFTAAAILQLRDAGKLKLGDSICDYLDPCPAAWRPATIQTLLNHTSGVVDYEEPRGLGSPAYIAFVTQPGHISTIIAEAAAKPLEFTPGTKWHYSNTGYILLSKVVAKASGRSFQDYVEANVLGRAGMRNSMLFRNHLIPNVASGYEIRDLNLTKVAQGVNLTDPVAIAPRVMGDFSGEHGDANLITNSEDMFKWISALGDGRVIGAASLAEMTTAGRASYGYGVEVSEQFGTKFITHTGGLPGFSSRLSWYPAERLTVVVLSNVEGVRFSKVASDLAAIALGKPYDIPRARRIASVPVARLARWAGNYSVPGGVATVALKDGALHYKSPEGREFMLMPESESDFYVPATEGSLRFTRGQNGRRARLTLQYQDVEISGVRHS